MLHLDFDAPFDDYMAEVLGVSVETVAGYAADFERIVLVFLTGWPLEVIDRMGVKDAGRVVAGLGRIREHMAEKRATRR